MDKEIAAEFERIKLIHIQLRATIMIAACQTAVAQAALAKVVKKLEDQTLDGLPVENWIAKNVSEAIQTVLVNCPDEQLAAVIRDHIARTTGHSGLG